ncbi:Thioredoxin domain-containing protein/TPR_8 domain-containing protein/TPR_11 domain-containing protein [Cephalotus follicularis]|uniref:Thioredoxin domain-containing protein/TPR_8 domain-containing protein/TPR_11 domain-containing protein n=1 Tax=Cephalotus follicularis TaxID=3775 RepID=A0A1Q3AU34_CEPFO|nr:Thioredoxin domain-containing protein/TPR_8 domain-containing protein/TPR_11 domain-containing protein [Cephalotus follicularis]
MTELSKYSMEEHGLCCGFKGRIFQLRSYWPSKESVPSLTAKRSTNIFSNDDAKRPQSHNSQRRQSSLVDSAMLDASKLAKPSQKLDQKSSNKPNIVPSRPSIGRRTSDVERTSTSSSSSSGQTKVSKPQDSGHSTVITRVITSSPLQSNDKSLVRATSTNIMVSGNLGNLRQQGTGSMQGSNGTNATVKTVDHLHRNLREDTLRPTTRYGHKKHSGQGVMGNIVRQSSGEIPHCKGLMSRVDPEALKNMGNEAYKRGSFDEALGLYDRAIALDSKKAIYRCNRSAALIGLGRLMEAVIECREAIRLDSSYQRAHHRLATLYVRLGEAEKAMHHFLRSGSHADAKDITQAQALQNHLSQCTEARKLKEWKTLLNETLCAISSGADSAPQVYAMQADALLKLNRHEDAYAAYQKGPKFSIDSCTKIFGPADSASLLMIRAQVYMAAGRFGDSIAAAQNAARLDSSNKDVQALVRRARAVASARLSGNLLYKTSKFSEACTVYSDGLQNEPYNSILLCNRAACRYKLGQYENAVADCTIALNVRPSYRKARIRRAECSAKMERWEAAIQDYEMLIRETSGDEEIVRALFEAKVQLKKEEGEDSKDRELGSNLVFISSNEKFRHFLTSPGMIVVLFCNKEKNKQVLQLMVQVCTRFPFVNFLKVEVEDHPYLAKSEGVRSIPAFKIYKNGSMVKEIPGNSRELLETTVKLYSMN